MTGMITASTQAFNYSIFTELSGFCYLGTHRVYSVHMHKKKAFHGNAAGVVSLQLHIKCGWRAATGRIFACRGVAEGTRALD